MSHCCRSSLATATSTARGIAADARMQDGIMHTDTRVAPGRSAAPAPSRTRIDDVGARALACREHNLDRSPQLGLSREF
jgi:hypothetical protein